MILFDAHVHIYDCYELTSFFDTAYKNFRSAASKLGHENNFIGVLLLAETSRENWFQHFSESINGKKLPNNKTTGTWKLLPTEDPVSLCIRSEGKQDLIIIGGRQLISAEGLELLALATTQTFKDGIAIRELLESVTKKGGISIIPWGFGKWKGRRGRILKNLIDSSDQDGFLLGDNGGRMKHWPQPYHFKLAASKKIKILPGSDPMPLKSEYGRIGSYGFAIDSELPLDRPTRILKKLIMSPHIQPRNYGSLSRPLDFVLRQIMVRAKGFKVHSRAFL